MNKLIILLGLAAVSMIAFSMLHETVPDYGEEHKLYLAYLNDIADKVNTSNTTWKAGHNKYF